MEKPSAMIEMIYLELSGIIWIHLIKNSRHLHDGEMDYGFNFSGVFITLGRSRGPMTSPKTSSAYFSIDGSRGVEIRQLLLPSLHVLSCICNDLQFYLKTLRVFFLRGHTCSHILSYDFPLVVLSSRRDNMVAQVEVGIL